MQRTDLEHIIRASANVTGFDTLIVIGSQAVLAQFPGAPVILTLSEEADVYAPEDPETSDLIDGALGAGSAFHKTHKVFADGVSPRTATTAPGWRSRLFPLCNANTQWATGWCIDTHDLAIAKYIAGREKDMRFNGGLWSHSMIDHDTLNERLERTPITPGQREAVLSRIRSHQPLHGTERTLRPTAAAVSTMRRLDTAHGMLRHDLRDCALSYLSTSDKHEAAHKLTALSGIAPGALDKAATRIARSVQDTAVRETNTPTPSPQLWDRCLDALDQRADDLARAIAFYAWSAMAQRDDSHARATPRKDPP